MTARFARGRVNFTSMVTDAAKVIAADTSMIFLWLDDTTTKSIAAKSRQTNIVIGMTLAENANDGK